MSFSEWEMTKLSEVVDVLGDGLHGTPKYTEDGNYYFMNGNNLEGKIVIGKDTKRVSYEEYLKYKKELNDRTIFVSINGTLGKVALYNGENVVLGKSACYFNVKEDVNKHYVKYVMLNNDFKLYMNTHSTGTTIKNMGLKAMREYSFALPPLAEQKSIAHILSTLDEKIEVNNQINKTLETVAQVLFKQWFIDFEFPNENGEPYKSSGGEMVESELGLIPKGWEVQSVEDICTITSSKRIFMNDYVDEGIPFYRSKEVIEKSVGNDISTELFISLEKYNHIKDKFGVPQQGDLLLTSVGTLGNVYKVRDEKIYFKDGNLTWFKDFKNIEMVNILYLWLRSSEGKRAIDSITIGSTQKALTIAGLKKLKIIRPSIENLRLFETLACPMINEIEILCDQSSELNKIRDTLLPKLMSGVIRVPIEEN